MLYILTRFSGSCFLSALLDTSREKANLAVTLANEKDDILAHASFFDHPVGDLVDQTHWEPFLQKHFRAKKITVSIIHEFRLKLQRDAFQIDG